VKREKLAILVYSMASGGAERAVSVLLPELIRFFDVTLVLMNDEIFYEIPGEVKIRYLERSDPSEPGWKKLAKLPRLALKYRDLCREEGIGISLSFMTRPNYINLLAKKWGGDVRTIISERAMPSLQYGYPGIASRINRRLIRSLYPGADRIVSNSEGNREDLIRNFGISAGMIETIYNPFDLERIRKSSAETAPGEKNGFEFITVGRIDAGKNHRMLIDAFLEAEIGNSVLSILGEGPLKKELEEYARNAADPKKTVRFPGRRKNPFSWMARADCFVFASRHEGFPNVLVEALACSLPVISTDCPSGPREILDERREYDEVLPGVTFGKYGILVPVDDKKAMISAMEKVYNNAVETEKYRRQGRNRAESFAREKIVPEFVRVLKGEERG